MKRCLALLQSPTYIAGCMHKCCMGCVILSSAITYHETDILCKASKHLHTDLTKHFVTHLPAYTMLVLMACQQQLWAGAGSCTRVTTLSLLSDISARQLPVHARMACWGCALCSSTMLLTMPIPSGSLTYCFASGFIMLTCAMLYMIVACRQKLQTLCTVIYDIGRSVDMQPCNPGHQSMPMTAMKSLAEQVSM